MPAWQLDGDPDGQRNAIGQNSVRKKRSSSRSAMKRSPWRWPTSGVIEQVPARRSARDRVPGFVEQEAQSRCSSQLHSTQNAGARITAQERASTRSAGHGSAVEYLVAQSQAPQHRAARVLRFRSPTSNTTSLPITPSMLAPTPQRRWPKRAGASRPSAPINWSARTGLADPSLICRDHIFWMSFTTLSGHRHVVESSAILSPLAYDQANGAALPQSSARPAASSAGRIRSPPSSAPTGHPAGWPGSRRSQAASSSRHWLPPPGSWPRSAPRCLPALISPSWCT